ncbi:MAG: hypothetical protein KKH41_04890 [Candidatus Thermoplasmatota archaeon]|nr:hypothetical protein [Euryarchaeota archaeon]MBU4031858.1 hypothetical protein [Candidatus Thermoplasmatota archaeon]MBU4591904.1 hypothetical protein [Candidatus Thermoplasmatota archaeon]
MFDICWFSVTNLTGLAAGKAKCRRVSLLFSSSEPEVLEWCAAVFVSTGSVEVMSFYDVYVTL